MKNKMKNLPSLWVWVAATLIATVAPSAYASATIASYITVTYTIDSIINQTQPNNLSELAMTGDFDLASIPNNPFLSLIGSGSAGSTLNGTGTTSVQGSFSRTMKFDAAVDNWSTLSANYIAWYSLGFANQSQTDTYEVKMTLSYELFASAGGNGAFTEVTAIYRNEDGSINNEQAPDYVQASPELIAQSLGQNSQVFEFIVAPGGSETVYLDATISATAAPVPLPAAVWSFLGGLMGMLGIKKRKQVNNPAAFF